jgi:hypothetical protein
VAGHTGHVGPVTSQCQAVELDQAAPAGLVNAQVDDCANGWRRRLVPAAVARSVQLWQPPRPRQRPALAEAPAKVDAEAAAPG